MYGSFMLVFLKVDWKLDIVKILIKQGLIMLDWIGRVKQDLEKSFDYN